ncbi:putative efflux protein, MATE family [Anaerobranca californiensis DSM 14826]|uniref:Putative efflux protein, MATE family n=1 Tax=Anaerobranca californiensis DSM 14826 TaxID=1120989 RepID=A0A1M6P0E1_9FIRM|nr:MATE family efflux transporter [Anaerobranca californiensis]SHK01457.1 putative efflux protein, MATE family [Anaerobranca californiensis DSM 14826]
MQKKIDLTKGNIVKNLYRLSLPIMAGMFLQTMFNIVDTLFVTRLGGTALAAVSLHLPIFFLLLALANSVAIGTSSLIARSLGADDYCTAKATAGQSMTLAILIALITTVVGLIAAPHIFALTGAEGKLLSYAISYNSIIFIGNIFFFTYAALDGILRGEGDMRTSMIILVIATLCNIILDPILIFGFGPIPKMGVQGAALATVFSRALGLYFIIRHFIKGKSSIKFKFSLVWNFKIIKGIFVVGIPTSISQVMLSLSLFVYNQVAMLYSESAVAALGLGFRIDSLAFLPGLGISVATVTLIGQNFGAGKIDRVKKGYLAALINAFIIMGTFGLIFLTFPHIVLKIFNPDQEVLFYTLQYLRTIPLFYGFLGIGFISVSAFQGIGEGLPGLVTNFIRLGVVGIPMAYILSMYFSLEAQGIWWAIALSDITFGCVGCIWFLYRLKYLTGDRGVLWEK